MALKHYQHAEGCSKSLSVPADLCLCQQPQPSKAALELAENVIVCNNEITAAKMIQSALADLLEKAGTVADGYHTQSDLDALAAALELWRKA